MTPGSSPSQSSTPESETASSRDIKPSISSLNKCTFATANQQHNPKSTPSPQHYPINRSPFLVPTGRPSVTPHQFVRTPSPLPFLPSLSPIPIAFQNLVHFTDNTLQRSLSEPKGTGNLFLDRMTSSNPNQSPSGISSNQFSAFNSGGNYSRGIDKTEGKNLLPELIARLNDEKPTNAELMTSSTFSESGQPSPSLTSHSSAPNLRFQSSSGSGDAMLSATINYNENEMLADGSGFDMSVPTNLDLGDTLLQGGTAASMNTSSGATFDLFGDSDYNMDTQPDLQLSPHGYTDTSVGLQLPEQEHRQGGAGILFSCDKCI